MRWLLGIACMLSCGLSSAWAAKVDVRLVDAHGHPVGDAVVTLIPDIAADDAQAAPVTRVIDQKDETFVPYVQILRPGDKVVFRNSDTTRHHVYSFASIKTFQFVLAPGESSPAIVVDKAGIAAVGCNIHDHMITYLFVSAVPAVALSSSDGEAILEQLTPGRYTAHVWHPQLHPGQPELTKSLVVHDDAVGHLAFTLSLMPDPRMFMDREHLDY
jgi:plastocyanin